MGAKTFFYVAPPEPTLFEVTPRAATTTTTAESATYKMRGILSGVYTYWDTTNPLTGAPVGATDITIVAMIVDRTGL